MIALVPGLNLCGLGVAALAARAEPALVSDGGSRVCGGVETVTLLEGTTDFLVTRRLRGPPTEPAWLGVRGVRGVRGLRGVRGVRGGILRGTRGGSAAFSACTLFGGQGGQSGGTPVARAGREGGQGREELVKRRKWGG